MNKPGSKAHQCACNLPFTQTGFLDTWVFAGIEGVSEAVKFLITLSKVRLLFASREDKREKKARKFKTKAYVDIVELVAWVAECIAIAVL